MSTTEVAWRQPGNGSLTPARVTATGYFVISVVCLAIALFFPALLIIALPRSGAAFPGWALALAVVVCLGMAFFGFTLWRTYKHGRRDTKLIDASGHPAIAEILTVGPAQWSEGDGIRLRLRISGQGFEPFEAFFEWKNTIDFKVGGQLAVMVEPAAHLFMVKV